MFCNNCGKELPNGVAFCTACGAPQREDGAGQPQSGAPSHEAPDGGASYQTQRNSFVPPAQNFAPPYVPPQPQIPSLGSYIAWLILTGIPVVNLILGIVWAVDKSYPARANFFRASLILLAISCVVSVLFSTLFAGVFAVCRLFFLFGTLFFGLGLQVFLICLFDLFLLLFTIALA